MILMKDDFRVALVTGHIPVSQIASTITKELIEEKLAIFNQSLKQDFAIDAPRIAVLSLNPHAEMKVCWEKKKKKLSFRH